MLHVISIFNFFESKSKGDYPLHSSLPSSHLPHADTARNRIDLADTARSRIDLAAHDTHSTFT